MNEPTTWQIVEEEFDCQHEGQDIRRRMCSNGTMQYVMQCLECGKTFQPLSHGRLTAEQRAAVRPVDDSLATAWYELKRARLLELRQAQRKVDHAQWQMRSAEYRRSPIWKAKRDQVFRRDGYVCQACLEAQATEVHHTAYGYPEGYEPLYTLYSVCRPCHERITQMDRARRGESWLNDNGGGR